MGLQKYIRWSTAGARWKGASLWYFLNVREMKLFVIRPWWGKRIIVHLESGTVLKNNKEFEFPCLEQERRDVLAELKLAVETRKEWESNGKCPCVQEAYLAGALGIQEAIPLLMQMEDCEYSGSSPSSSQVARVEGRVNPFNYSTFSLRKAIQLSLRRLGEHPRPFPVTEFKVESADYDKRTKFTPPKQSAPRHENASKVKLGMSAEAIITLIGEPDYADDAWEYDLESTPPCTLILTWGQPLAVQLGLGKEGPAQVNWIQRQSPPRWAKGLTRDQQLAE